MRPARTLGRPRPLRASARNPEWRSDQAEKRRIDGRRADPDRGDGASTQLRSSIGREHADAGPLYPPSLNQQARRQRTDRRIDYEQREPGKPRDGRRREVGERNRSQEDGGRHQPVDSPCRATRPRSTRGREAGLGFLMPSFLLLIIGFDPLTAGLALIPSTVPVLLFGPLAGGCSTGSGDALASGSVRSSGDAPAGSR
jgi:hypothetical protein